MAYRITTTLGAAALVLGCLSVVPAMAQETATPSSPETADKDTSAKMHPMHHRAMHPEMHGKMHSHKMHSGESMAEGKSMQGVRAQDMGTDALNNQSLHAAQSNSSFTPGPDSAQAMPGGMHGKMMHGRMMHGSMDQGSMGSGSMGSGSMGSGSMSSGSTGGTSMGSGSMGTGSMGSGSMGSGSMGSSSMGSGSMGSGAGGTMPAQTSGATGAMGGGTGGNGAMAGSSTGGVGGAATTPKPTSP